jgi:hypothetical protein
LCGKVDFSVTLHPGARCKHLYCTGIALYSFIKSAVAKAKMFPHLEAWVQRTKRLYLIFHGLVALKIKVKNSVLYAQLSVGFCLLRPDT